MNYEKEKVCGWHDAHIGLYTSVIKGLKEAEKVKFEGLYHIYDYALKLLLGSDYQPLYDPNNPHDVLGKRFNTLKMSGAHNWNNGTSIRKKESLSLRILASPRTPIQRQQNKDTLELALP